MKKHTKLVACAAAALLMLAEGTALAESEYGYSTATGNVSATAKVNLSVTVPKLIILRIGSSGTTQDTLAWTAAFSIPGTPTTPTTTQNNVDAAWTGAAPTLTIGAQPSAINVYAWTNAGAGSISCAMGTWVGTGNPANSDFAVTSSAGGLTHPGANLGACGSATFTSNTVVSGTWTYVLSGTVATWGVGTHTNTVTYTALGV